MTKEAAKEQEYCKNIVCELAMFPLSFFFFFSFSFMFLHFMLTANLNTVQNYPAPLFFVSKFSLYLFWLEFGRRDCAPKAKGVTRRAGHIPNPLAAVTLLAGPRTGSLFCL